MKSLLLYADDPGGANYLVPLKSGLEQAGFQCSFLVDPALSDFVQQRHMGATIRCDKSAADMLTGIDLLLVGTSEDRTCFAHQLTDFAKQKNIPSVGVVDMAVNAAGRFQGLSGDPLCHAPTWLAVPDDGCRAAYINLGFPAEKIAVCGHPHFDAVRAKRDILKLASRTELRNRIYPEAPPDRPIWLFLAEGVDRLNPSQSYRTPDYKLVGRGDTNFRACIVLEELMDAVAPLTPRPWVVLRPHPKTEIADFSPVLDELGGVQQGGDPLEAIWAADMVVGMTTMLLQETLLLEHPHFSIVPRALEIEWLPTLAQGLTPFAMTRDEIRSLVAMEGKNFSDSASTLPKGASGHVLELIDRVIGSQ